MADTSPDMANDEILAYAGRRFAEMTAEHDKQAAEAMADLDNADDSDEQGRAEYRLFKAMESREKFAYMKKQIKKVEAKAQRDAQREAKRQEKLAAALQRQIEKEKAKDARREARRIADKEKRRAYYLAHPEQSKQRYQEHKAEILQRQKSRYDAAKIINVRTQCPTCGKSLLTNSIPLHSIRFHAAAVAPAVV